MLFLYVPFLLLLVFSFLFWFYLLPAFWRERSVFFISAWLLALKDYNPFVSHSFRSRTRHHETYIKGSSPQDFSLAHFALELRDKSPCCREERGSSNQCFWAKSFEVFDSFLSHSLRPFIMSTMSCVWSCRKGFPSLWIPLLFSGVLPLPFSFYWECGGFYRSFMVVRLLHRVWSIIGGFSIILG